ncbi:Bidirectional sugar transporter sweet16 [Thalictrum thalictroides]|uniref:Bidirectional sugar transporter SWEET n=1 Tax=Thalictrum thalictroides TaxID=46969 RepID=A0A7J6WYR6_THATH|nr:Bidirectional sugar transporter sweet16 [Thalictrum thalictroides]
MASLLSVIVAIVGNIISILLFLSPVGTFKRVVKKKSIENFSGITYVCTLLSTSLWTFYGILKPGGFLVATVNGAGAFLQSIYIILYLIYAPKDTKVKYLKLVGALNIGCLGLVIALILFVVHGSHRLNILGLLCAGLTLAMYGSPLSAMRTVMKTKSVEYMSFLLSFFLSLNAAVWSAYAVLVKDYFIGVPNAIGLVLGLAQLALYLAYHKQSGSTSKSMLEDLEEEGSAHLVQGDLQMGESKLKEKKKDWTLSKGRSLPKTPVSVSRQHSLQMIVRAHSLNPCELQSKWSLEDSDLKNAHAVNTHH